jgi:hypothetical protein
MVALSQIPVAGLILTETQNRTNALFDFAGRLWKRAFRLAGKDQ